jgi:hypothetical protein
MATTIAQRLAQLAIPLIATSILGSCAPEAFEELGKPLPPMGEVKRLPPYDPFGTGRADDPEDAEDEQDADAPAAQGLGARPQEPVADSEGQNTVSKTQLAAVYPPDSTPGTPAPPIDAGANLSPFAGLSAEELKAQWGAPSLTRNEAGAQLMQFKGKGCVVLAYLYPSTGGGMETAFAEAHPGGDTASAIAGCLGKKAKAPEAQAGTRVRKPELIVKPD